MVLVVTDMAAARMLGARRLKGLDCEGQAAGVVLLMAAEVVRARKFATDFGVLSEDEVRQA